VTIFRPYLKSSGFRDVYPSFFAHYYKGGIPLHLHVSKSCWMDPFTVIRYNYCKALCGRVIVLWVSGFKGNIFWARNISTLQTVIFSDFLVVFRYFGDLSSFLGFLTTLWYCSLHFFQVPFLIFLTVLLSRRLFRYSCLWPVLWGRLFYRFLKLHHVICLRMLSVARFV